MKVPTKIQGHLPKLYRWTRESMKQIQCQPQLIAQHCSRWWALNSWPIFILCSNKKYTVSRRWQGVSLATVHTYTEVYCIPMPCASTLVSAPMFMSISCQAALLTPAPKLREPSHQRINFSLCFYRGKISSHFLKIGTTPRTYWHWQTLLHSIWTEDSFTQPFIS